MNQVETLQVLKKFCCALIEEIKVQRPEYLTSVFTVAEIYQNLLPYGSNRERIGVEVNGDYEEALLRLLAGEGGFLILESEVALRDLQAELETTNPNVGLYRDYAAADVRLNKACLEMDSSAVSGELEPVHQTEAAELETDLHVSEIEFEDGFDLRAKLDTLQSANVTWDQRDQKVLADGSNESPSSEDNLIEGQAEKDGVTCQSCKTGLPVKHDLNFCPFCGTDLKIVRCDECSKELLVEWRFCVSCGTEVGG